MRMKRLFSSLVCLVLVFSLVAPVVAFAVGGTIYLGTYKDSEVDKGSYIEQNFSYSDGHFAQCTYYVGSTYTFDTFNSRTILFDYGARTGSGKLIFYVGYCDTYQLTHSSKKYDGFLLDGIIDQENFKQLTFDLPFNIKSSVSTTITVKAVLQSFGKTGGSMYKYESSPVTVSLPAGSTVSKSVSVSISSLQSGEAYVVPYIYIEFASPPSSGDLTIDSYYFTAKAKVGTGLPDYPAFTQNIGGTYTYLKGEDAPAFSVAASVTDGGSVSYRWYRNYSQSVTGATYLSAGASRKPSTSELGTSYYYCVATNTLPDGKTADTVSGFVRVDVIDPPREPQISQNIGPGIIEYEKDVSANFLQITAISTDGGQLSYQWYVSGSESMSGAALITGADTFTYRPSTSKLGLQYYQCVITNTVAGYTSTISSGVVGIRVVPAPDPAQIPGITSNLNTAEVVYEQGTAAAALRIGASVTDGGTLTYQWYSSDHRSSSGGTAIPGATTASFTPETVVVGTKYYYCVIRNTLRDTTASATSNVAWVTVVAPPPDTVPPQLDEMNNKLDDTNDKLDGVNDQLGDTNEKLDGVNDQLGDTNEKLDGVNDQLGDTNEKLDGVNDQLGDTNEKLEESNSLLGNIVQGILDLPQAILDGIKGLFVPDTETMAAYKDRWDSLLASRFGAIYESIAIIDDFASSLRVYDRMNVIEFPSVNVNLAGADWTFGGWVVDVIPDGFGFLVEILKKGVSVIATFAFLNAMRNKFEGILGGGKM